MFEESVSSVPSIWASMNSWFTPTIFFLLLNVMIATIYVTSTLSAAPKHRPDHRDLVGSPSVLQRLKSVNFYTHRYQEPAAQFAHHPPPSAADLHSHSAADFHSNSATDFHSNSATDFDQRDSHFQDPHENRLFSRSSSVLQRLKSINLYNYLSHEPDSPAAADQTQTHVDADTVYGSQLSGGGEEAARQEGGDGEREVEPPAASEDELQPSMEEIYSKLQESGRMSRTKSDTKPASGEMPAKLARKMRKSASSKSAFGHFKAEEEAVEARRPATVREGKAEEEVDARADDFINKFKQQLKLQRIDSIIRYKEMIGRGSGSGSSDK